MLTFAIPFGKYAEVAQLVEHNLAKVGVASSSLVFRSKCSVRITVSTQDSQSCNRGSIPLPSTPRLTIVGLFLYICTEPDPIQWIHRAVKFKGNNYGKEDNHI